MGQRRTANEQQRLHRSAASKLASSKLVTMTTEGTPPLLDFHNLCVMRGQKMALDGFTLRIGADEHVAILGPNGCGKSTFIRTITRECYPLLRPDSSLAILGEVNWDVFDLRTRLGIVSNDMMLS